VVRGQRRQPPVRRPGVRQAGDRLL
jgi:hypothetical protein